jgi:hypothetical protein
VAIVTEELRLMPRAFGHPPLAAPSAARPSVGRWRETCQLLTRVAAGEIATGQGASRGSPHRLDGRP